MRHGLWDLYLRLQTSAAYGETSAHKDDPRPQDPRPDTERMVEFMHGVSLARSLTGALIIGPGGVPEVRALSFMPRPLHVLTAHRPEAEVVRAACPWTHVDVGDIHDMPYNAGVVDVVYASNVLEHCFAPYIALLECRRVLREGGLASLVVPTFDGPEGGRGPFHLHCLDERVWAELLRKTGLAVANTQIEAGAEPGAGYIHYRCVAVTPPHPHDKLLAQIIAHKTG